MVHYLLKWPLTAGRMKYLMRTAPPKHVETAAELFVKGVVEIYQAASGMLLNLRQCEQIHFKVRHDGLGIRSARQSWKRRTSVRDRCAAIRPVHRWEALESGSALEFAAAAISVQVASNIMADSMEGRTQKGLSKQVSAKRVERWREQGPPADAVRMNSS